MPVIYDLNLTIFSEYCQIADANFSNLSFIDLIITTDCLYCTCVLILCTFLLLRKLLLLNLLQVALLVAWKMDFECIILIH